MKNENPNKLPVISIDEMAAIDVPVVLTQKDWVTIRAALAIQAKNLFHAGNLAGGESVLNCYEMVEAQVQDGLRNYCGVEKGDKNVH